MHQNRASPFASDFCRRRGYRREFRSEDHFYPFYSQKKSRIASDFLRRGNRASWGLKRSRDFFLGAVKIAAAAAENRAILVHSGVKQCRDVTKNSLDQHGPKCQHNLGVVKTVLLARVGGNIIILAHQNRTIAIASDFRVD